VMTTELRDVEQLLERALPDPVGFLDRVVEQLFERALGSPAATSPQTVVTGVDASAYRRLEDRNVVLAAALGACECWGLDPECGECAGDGTSGWFVPDARLYEDYVVPAVRRMPDPLGSQRDPRQPDDELHKGEPG
jgi:hypothetical protein